MMLSPLLYSTACGIAAPIDEEAAACCISHDFEEIDEEIDEALWSD